MTATINDLIEDPFADLPRRRACPAEDFAAPVLTVTVNDEAVLSIARRLHDGTCLHREDCGLRDFHAMDAYEMDVRVMLAAMVQAGQKPTVLKSAPAARQLSADGSRVSGAAQPAAGPSALAGASGGSTPADVARGGRGRPSGR